MNSITLSVAALVASAAAQAGYGAPSYGQSSSAWAPAYNTSTTSASPMSYPTTMSTSSTANATSPGVYGSTTVTDVVSSFTTYCPEATTLTYGTKTYTVSSATTLTITDCPCTLTSSMPMTYPTGNATDVYVTAVETSYTTYCPYATTYTVPVGSGPAKTYTVSSATTLTVTECPGGCHVTKPVKSMAPTETITAVVSSYTTYCPSATTITYGPSTSPVTMTVATPSTVTISQCPGGCTVTAPVSAITPPPYMPTSPAVPSNGTSPVSPSSSGITPYTGAAEKVMAGGSLMAAAVAAVFFL